MGKNSGKIQLGETGEIAGDIDKAIFCVYTGDFTGNKKDTHQEIFFYKISFLFVN